MDYLTDTITQLPATALNITLEKLQELQKEARITQARAERAEAKCDWSTPSIEALEALEDAASFAFKAYNNAYHSRI